MTAADLVTVLEAAAHSGVTYLKVGDITIRFPATVPERKTPLVAAEDTVDALACPANVPENVQVSVEKLPSDDEMLLWSTQLSPTSEMSETEAEMSDKN